MEPPNGRMSYSSQIANELLNIYETLNADEIISGFKNKFNVHFISTFSGKCYLCSITVQVLMTLFADAFLSWEKFFLWEIFSDGYRVWLEHSSSFLFSSQRVSMTQEMTFFFF